MRFFGHIPEPLFVSDQVPTNVYAVKQDMPTSGLDQASQDLDRGAFSRPVWAKITEYFASGNLKRDILHGGDARVELGQTLDLQHVQLDTANVLGFPLS